MGDGQGLTFVIRPDPDFERVTDVKNSRKGANPYLVQMSTLSGKLLMSFPAPSQEAGADLVVVTR
jgi:hypothetical protein